MQAPAQFSRVFWFLSHTCPLVQTKVTKHRDEIITEKLVIFFADECHLLWGDICGYVWGKKQERIEIPITNEKERQTYYGAVNLYTQECESVK